MGGSTLRNTVLGACVCAILLIFLQPTMADSQRRKVIVIDDDKSLNALLTEHENRLRKLEGANLSNRIQLLSEQSASHATRLWELEKELAKLKSASSKDESLRQQLKQLESKLEKLKTSVAKVSPLADHIDVSELSDKCRIIFRWTGSSILTLAHKGCARKVVLVPNDEAERVLVAPPQGTVKSPEKLEAGAND